MPVADPAFPSGPDRVLELVQTRDNHGFPSGYSARITTDVCMDKKCRTVEVTLHWNAAGNFARLEYPPDKPLTKKEHEPFTTADYAKLDRILKDRTSILARHSLAFLAKPSADTPGIDAWSGATPLTIQESVVEHAAYTTWVLWHWANGPLVQKLRQFTGQSCSPPCLQHFLRSADRSCVDFALEFLQHRPPAGSRFLPDLLYVVETGDRELVSKCLRLLKNSAGHKDEPYLPLVRSIARMSPALSPLVLEFLAAEPELPAPVLEELTGSLKQLPYFQVHLILRMLEQRKHCTTTTESDVSKLLDGDDFFIARRACEFLENQALSPETGRKVREFRARNRDRM